jgi:hypothetical protein
MATATFLEDWCYPNPKWENGKELCDLLVVFDDTAIIWSVKNLKLQENGQFRASEVEKSKNQLLGAYRHLFDLKQPIKLINPRRREEIFDPSKIKNVHLISALLGENEEEISAGLEEQKSKFIHTLNRSFTEILLNELDTISDFSSYLLKKEELFREDKQLYISGGEEELLATYITNGQTFDPFKKANMVFMEEGSWKELQENPKYIEKKRVDKISYAWDGIINRAHEGSSEYERVARELARPNRFQRRVLAKTFLDTLINGSKHKDRPVYRRMFELEGTSYCFVLFDDKTEKREDRKSLLGACCFVVRGTFKNNHKVLGIATEKTVAPICSYDFCLMELPEWNEELEKAKKTAQEEHGIFANYQETPFSEDEYPDIVTKMNTES